MLLLCPSRLLSRAIGYFFRFASTGLTEPISTKFAGENHYYQKIKWSHFGRNWTGRKDATEYSNRRQTGQVLTPSE